MKKIIVTIALGLTLPLIGMAQSTLGPGIMGTTLTVPGMPHNFSGQSWNLYDPATTLGNQICQPCHTPHNAISVPEAPLWNHQFSTATYQIYQSIKNLSTMGVTAIDGTSKLCLSCHDGTVALGSFGGQTGTEFISGGANFGTDLRNDHPVSVDYAFALAGGYGGLQPTTYMYMTYDPAANTYSPGTKAVSSMLDATGKVQCTSCHSAHSNSRGYQLRMSNRGSALCLACHRK